MKLSTDTQSAIKAFVEANCPIRATTAYNNSRIQPNNEIKAIQQFNWAILEILSHPEIKTLLSQTTIEGEKSSISLKKRIIHHFPNTPRHTRKLILAFCRQSPDLNTQISYFDYYFMQQSVVNYMIDQIVLRYSIQTTNTTQITALKKSSLIRNGLSRWHFSPATWADTCTVGFATIIVATLASTIANFTDTVIILFSHNLVLASLLSGFGVPVFTFIVSSLVYRLILKWRCSTDSATQINCKKNLLKKSKAYKTLIDFTPSIMQEDFKILGNCLQSCEINNRIKNTTYEQENDIQPLSINSLDPVLQQLL